MSEKDYVTPDNKGMIRAGIAVVILSMAIGNMFVSRRLKHMGKVNPFRSQSKAQEAKSTSSEAHESQTNYKQHERHFKSHHYTQIKSSIPSHVIGSFNTLELNVTSLSQLPNASQLKAAYHKLAMKHHPDRLPADADIRKKRECELKFQDISTAYTDALKYIEKL